MSASARGDRPRAERVVLHHCPPDLAGARAAERAFGFQEQYPVQAVVMIMPDGLDPAEFVAKHGADEVLAAASAARPMVEYMVRRKVERHVAVSWQRAKLSDVEPGRGGERGTRVHAEDSHLACRHGFIVVAGHARVDVLAHHRQPSLVRARRRVDEQRVAQREDAEIGDDLSFRRERGSVATLAGREGGDVIRHQSGDELAVGATVLTVLGSLMVSYTRARGEALGVECKVGIASRPVRVVILSAGLVFAAGELIPDVDLLEPAIYAMAALTIFTTFQRVFHVRRQLQRAAV